jgi:polyferredoxin
VRPRTILYLVVWVTIGLGMLTALSLRSPLSVSVLHDRNPLYVVMRDGAVSNGYDLKVLNMTPAPRSVTVAIDGLPGATISVAEHDNLTPTSITLDLEPDKVMALRAYVEVSPEALPAAPVRFALVVTSDDGAVTSRAEATFEIPEDK